MNINSALRSEMEKDIELCEKHSTADGSQQLYGKLVAKYSVIDTDFSKNLSTGGKMTTPGIPFNYCPELQAIANKLRIMLLLSETAGEPDTENPLLNKVKEFLERGKIIGKEEYHPAEGGFPLSYVGGPEFNKWMGDIKVFNERYLQEHPLYESINIAYKQRSNQPGSYDDMIGYLESLIEDRDFFEKFHSEDNSTTEEKVIMSNKVFIVHGHDSAAKESMARTLEKAGFEAIILHEQADMGLTIIEKIEAYTDVSFAVVLYTECDLGRAKEQSEADNKFRARQNVVFEHGYLIGKLGRDHVNAFVKGNVETPGDISGVVYTNMDDAGAWKMTLAKNMNAVGLSPDIYKMM